MYLFNAILVFSCYCCCKKSINRKKTMAFTSSFAQALRDAATNAAFTGTGPITINGRPGALDQLVTASPPEPEGLPLKKKQQTRRQYTTRPYNR